MLILEAPKDALVRAINKANKLSPPLQPEDVGFGLPEVHINGTTNTRILVNMIKTHNYSGSFTFYYRRVQVKDYLAGWKVPGKATDFADSDQAIRHLISVYQLPLNPDEFVNLSINYTDNIVTLRPRSNSLIFVPNLAVELGFTE